MISISVENENDNENTIEEGFGDLNDGKSSNGCGRMVEIENEPAANITSPHIDVQKDSMNSSILAKSQEEKPAAALVQPNELTKHQGSTGDGDSNDLRILNPANSEQTEHHPQNKGKVNLLVIKKDSV